MLQIPIANVANQTFSVTIGDNFYDFVLRMCAATSRVEPFYRAPIMAMDIVRNDVAIVTGQRCVANFPIIPYRYLEDGNFIITTDNDDLPDWNQFGITQFLIYASADELATIR